jgi:hypothetical protein
MVAGLGGLPLCWAAFCDALCLEADGRRQPKLVNQYVHKSCVRPLLRWAAAAAARLLDEEHREQKQTIELGQSNLDGFLLVGLVSCPTFNQEDTSSYASA